jgi:hypothetical protein
MSGILDAFSGGSSGTGTSTGASRPKSILSSGGRNEDLPAGEVLPEERDRVSAIQRQLAQETLFRNRGYGLRSLLGPLGGAKTSLLGSG